MRELEFIAWMHTGVRLEGTRGTAILLMNGQVIVHLDDGTLWGQQPRRAFWLEAA